MVPPSSNRRARAMKLPIKNPITGNKNRVLKLDQNGKFIPRSLQAWRDRQAQSAKEAKKGLPQGTPAFIASAAVRRAINKEGPENERYMANGEGVEYTGIRGVRAPRSRKK